MKHLRAETSAGASRKLVSNVALGRPEPYLRGLHQYWNEADRRWQEQERERRSLHDEAMELIERFEREQKARKERLNA